MVEEGEPGGYTTCPHEGREPEEWCRCCGSSSTDRTHRRGYPTKTDKSGQRFHHFLSQLPLSVSSSGLNQRGLANGDEARCVTWHPIGQAACSIPPHVVHYINGHCKSRLAVRNGKMFFNGNCFFYKHPEYFFASKSRSVYCTHVPIIRCSQWHFETGQSRHGKRKKKSGKHAQNNK